VSQGDDVAAGDILVTLESGALQADRQEAVAILARTVAIRDELLAGPQTESRAATAQNIALKQTTLETVRTTQANLVANAYRALLSTSLIATTDDADEEAVAPIVSGTYSCTAEGTYTIDTYSSSANSGYSFRLTGLESGTFPISTDQPVSLGTCGLRVLFDEDSRYNNTQSTITIPNQESAQYITTRNAYTLAQTQAFNAITIAEQDLELAEINAVSTNAPARSESVARANADIASANARIARVDAQIADRTIRAPFAGTITVIDSLPGETVGTTPVITLLAATDFELTARIPEIDIGKLALGQSVRTVFDAQPDALLLGSIEFISLQATEIDGVAYYEAIISLDDTPAWMRSGLNADIDIVIIDAADSLRVPSRFITQTDSRAQVRTKVGDQIATTTVNVTLTGNDGFTAITGLNQGDIVVAP
jgi:multidrug efflux pump subunit AcrA (membrane-fusion protein)